MALQDVPPRPDVLAVYQHALDDYFGPYKPQGELFHLPVGALGLEQLAKGATLNDVVPSGCKFFAIAPDGTQVACEMTEAGQYGTPKFRNIVEGDPVRAGIQRIQEAHGLEEAQNTEFELHFLSIPGIYFEGLHLVSQGNASDLVLPVLSLDPSLPTTAVLTAEAFLSKAREIAASRLTAASPDPLSS
jgi:hypothetical protein